MKGHALQAVGLRNGPTLSRGRRRKAKTNNCIGACRAAAFILPSYSSGLFERVVCEEFPLSPLLQDRPTHAFPPGSARLTKVVVEIWYAVDSSALSERASAASKQHPDRCGACHLWTHRPRHRHSSAVCRLQPQARCRASFHPRLYHLSSASSRPLSRVSVRPSVDRRALVL